MASPSTPADASSSRGARSFRRARQGGLTIFAVLQRLVPLARRLLWGVKALAIASAASIVVIVAVVLAHGVPSALTGGGLLLIVVVLVPAPVVLWLFHGALREVLALPDWLRRSPDIAKGHAAELAGLVHEARGSGPAAATGARPRRRRGGFLGDSVRAGRLLLQAHDDLPGYGAALRLVSPVFLIAVGVALFAAPLEILLASTAVLGDLLVRLIA